MERIIRRHNHRSILFVIGNQNSLLVQDAVTVQMEADSAALGCIAVEIGLLRLLRDSGTITEKEYLGIFEVAFRDTHLLLFELFV